MLVWNHLASEIRIRLIRLSLAFLITTNSIYRDKVVEILMSLASWRQWINPLCHHGECTRFCWCETHILAKGFSIAYDMIYEYLDTYKRITMQNALITHGIGPLYLESLYGELGSNLNQGGWQSLNNGGNWPNYYVSFNSMLGLSCLLLKDEFASEMPELYLARQRIEDLLAHNEICDTAGGYVEGVHYSGNQFATLTYFSIADSLAGHYGVINNPYWQRHQYFRIYSKVPGDNIDYALSHGRRELNFGDTEGGPILHRNGHLLRLATKYGQPMTQYYLRYAQSGHDFDYLLWMDADLCGEHPVGQLFGRSFPGIGWAMLRTGWHSDDYLLAMRSGHGVGHTHRDNNTIILGTMNRWLLVDAGHAYGAENPKHWPVNHNVLIVNGDTVNENDISGSITRFHVAEDQAFGYYRGDASSCYCELQKYTRDVVAVKDDSLLFFAICDHVRADSDYAIDSLTWLFHTWGDADWDSTSHSVCITDTQQLNNEYLRMNVMFPDDMIYDTIIIADDGGGDGTRTRVRFTKIYADSSSSLPLSEQFIVVMTADHNSPPSTAVTKIGGTGFVGAKVRNTLVVFGDRCDSVASGDYVVSCNECLLNIVCNLRVNEQYEIVMHNLENSCAVYDSLAANSEGILSFALLESGTWRVAVTYLDAWKSPYLAAHNSHLFDVYPTIFNTDLCIDVMGFEKYAGSEYSETCLRIYDVTGRLVRTFHNVHGSIKWTRDDDSGRKVPLGIYFVRFDTPDSFEVRKAVFVR
jgi:hypothetical protein